MIKKKPITTLHYNIGQLRIDTWNILRAQVTELAKATKDSTTDKKQLEAVKNSLKQLTSIERYFAFPGLNTVNSLQETCKQDEYVSISHKTKNIVHLLSNDAYRNLADIGSQEDWAKTRKKSINKKAVAAPNKNYFEVLFVDDLSEIAEVELKNRLQEMKDKNDQFFYQVVVQPSFQDTLIALLFN